MSRAAARSGRALGVALAAGVAVLGYALVEARSFVVRRYDVPVLPSGARPLRVLHLSDLHLVPSQRAKRRFVAGLAALEPDLTVVTGDFLAHETAVPAVVESLAGLLDRPGVFVLGSNDYFAPRPRNPLDYLRGPSEAPGDDKRLPTGELIAALTDRGWLDLCNARGELVVDGRRLRFVGVDDPHLGLDRLPAADGETETRRSASEPAALRIGVSHAPYLRVLDSMTADGADLVLAGHTHGGQLCVPGHGALVTNCDLPTRYARGLFTWSLPAALRDDDPWGPPVSSWVHVSAGIGTSPFTPVRLACPPEVSLLTLTAQE